MMGLNYKLVVLIYTGLIWITQSEGSIREVYAVVKQSASLPCDISSSVEGDSVILVVWYKDEMTPIYSYDSRGKQNEQATHWKDDEVLEERAYFRTITEPATLSIDNVEESDEGDYRCRVDFRKSQTKNHRIRLVVIVPPQVPTVIDDKGKEIQSVAGPYEEGDEMKLVCIVTGGKPKPHVRWWRGQTLIDTKDKPSGFAQVVNNQLVVPSLERSDLHAIYTCTASNTNITQPVSTAITVEMHLKPISVTILTSNNPLSADRKYELTCQSVGSRPPAKITWWKDNKQLDNFSEKISSDGNITTSILDFRATVKDHDKSLICRADNPMVKAGAEEDSVKLNVYYIPILQLELGSSLDPNDIEEGDDVYFECNIQANPQAYKVVWKHNRLPLQHNTKTGVILSNRALALQNVRRQQAGNYSCVASNVEGDGDSNIVTLNVMYKPLCSVDQKKVYGIARHEETKISCEVESFPPPTSFRWSFNNTAEIFEVPPESFSRDAQQTSQSKRFTSTLTYRPMNDMDYGTVMCWATNSAGEQIEPCVFHIIGAGHPDSPFNCTILNQTTVSLEVECIEGFDGGQPQWFQLEVFDSQTGSLQSNMSHKFPVFNVNRLSPGQQLRLTVTAVNNKGKSDPVILEGFTLKVAEKQTGTPVTLDIAPVLGYLVAGSVLVLAMALIAGVAWRKSQLKSPERPVALPLKEKVVLPLRSDVDDLYEMDDKNPDVVPCNKDSDYQLVSEAPTPGLNNKTEVFEDRNNITRNGGIHENFKNSSGLPNCKNINSPNEVTYAELCMSRPGSVDNKCKPPPILGPNFPLRHRDEPTIYAQIDHTRRPPPTEGTLRSPMTPVSLPAGPREIVTVRTPLMGHQQESCV